MPFWVVCFGFFFNIKYLSRLQFTQFYRRRTLHPTDSILLKWHADPMERQVATDLMSSLMNEWKWSISQILNV